MKASAHASWFAALSALLIAGCAHEAARDGEHYYSVDDYVRVPKIDAHMHIHGRAEQFMGLVTRDNFRLLTINVDYPDFPSIAEQQRDAIDLQQRYPERVSFAATFSVADFHSPDWAQRTISSLDEAVNQGAVGVKIWKNIGMTLTDADGRYVMPDDVRFEPVLDYIESKHLVLLGHQAEPLNCWLPLERMTVRSDREYFTEHPQYYMYRHPEMPSHDAILAARDRLLEAHPKLRFDAVHLASLEWDVDRIAAFLDRFPQANVDVAARMVHLEYQAARDPAKVRAFLIRYQDRIYYGSDASYGPDDAMPGALDEIRAAWVQDWRFLVSDEAMQTKEFESPFHGLHLPRDVVDKIYFRNAEAAFAGAWQRH